MKSIEANQTKRLDQKVVELVPELSRASAAKLIHAGKVKVNCKLATKASQTVSASDKVVTNYEPVSAPTIDLPIIYEDENCVVINKPAGVLTHSKGAFNPESTVASWLATKLTDISGERAGIVHRLDRATSGVMICAKNAAAHKFLQRQFANRKVKKTYLAVVGGEPEPAEAIIDMPIERNPKAPATFRAGASGKPAQTHYKIIKTSGKYSLLELKPTTGRTHQLRVHLKQIGHPILGDTLYEGEPASRLMLHASELEITLPGGERKTFKSQTPLDLVSWYK